jgi:hypothetical protein
MTPEAAMNRFNSEEPKPSFHRAKGLRFGSMAILRGNDIAVMRICDRFAEWGVSAGNRMLTIIPVRYLRMESFASRRYLVSV